MPSPRSWDAVKRPLDVATALIMLIGLIPILIVVFSLSWILLGRPIFFLQVRTGRYGKPFRLIKFRTMSKDQHDSRGDLVRVGRYGHFLRSSSIDELPSLINVLRGEMSMVGPRPLLREYDSLYSEKHRRRHLVRPGLTGLAQVAGRNRIEWNDRLDLDVIYVDTRSLALDVRILFKTAFLIFSRRAVNRDSSRTMPPLTEGYWTAKG